MSFHRYIFSILFLSCSTNFINTDFNFESALASSSRSVTFSPCLHCTRRRCNPSHLPHTYSQSLADPLTLLKSRRARTSVMGVCLACHGAYQNLQLPSVVCPQSSVLRLHRSTYSTLCSGNVFPYFVYLFAFASAIIFPLEINFSRAQVHMWRAYKHSKHTTHTHTHTYTHGLLAYSVF